MVKLFLCVKTKDVAALSHVKKKIEDKLGSDCTIKEPVLKEPRIKIVGDFSPDLSDNEIMDCLTRQNDFIMENAKIEVVKIKKRADYVCVIIKTDESTFKQMIKARKVKIQFSVCQIFEDIELIRCYKCSRMGHFMDNCPSASTICPNCTEAHEQRKCHNKYFKCINCAEMNHKMGTNESTDHASWSFLCPYVKRNWNKRKNRTVYMK